MRLHVCVWLGGIAVGGALGALLACGSLTGSRTNLVGAWDGSPENAGAASITGSVGAGSLPPVTGALWVGQIQEQGTEVIYLFTQPVACNTLFNFPDGGSWSKALAPGPYFEVKAHGALPGTYALYAQGESNSGRGKVTYHLAGSADNLSQVECGWLHLCSGSDCALDAGPCIHPLSEAGPAPVLDDAGAFDGSIWGSVQGSFPDGGSIQGTFQAVYCPNAQELQ